MGGCFVVDRPVHLEPDAATRSSPGMATFAVFLMLWVINWPGSFIGPTAQAVLDYLSITGPPRRLHQGVIDTQAPGLLLQLHRVRTVPDRRARWTPKGGAAKPMKQILNILSYVGIALVFGALAVRIYQARVGPIRDLRDVGRPGAGRALHARPVARDRRVLRRRNARYGAHGQRSAWWSCSASSSPSTTCRTRQNKRWDLTEQPVNSLSEQTVKLLQGLDGAGEVHRVRSAAQLRPLPRAARRSTATTSRQVTVEYIDPDKDPVAAKEYEIQTLRHGGRRVQGPPRTRDHQPDEREQDLTSALIKVLTPARSASLLRAGPRREGSDRHGTRPATARSSTRCGSDNYQWSRS